MKHYLYENEKIMVKLVSKSEKINICKTKLTENVCMKKYYKENRLGF